MIKLFVPVQPEDHQRGDTDAVVTLLEYGDFECPDCAAAQVIVEQLQIKFLPLRFVFRHFPLTQRHPFARRAAEISEAASEYFWEIYSYLLTHQPHATEETLLAMLEEKGLNREAVLTKAATEEVRARVKRDLKSGVRSGVGGTPSFFINEIKYEGKTNFEGLAESISIALGGKK